jgi:hypothetical protein
MEDVKAFWQMFSVRRFFLGHRGGYANTTGLKNQISNVESKNRMRYYYEPAEPICTLSLFYLCFSISKHEVPNSDFSGTGPVNYDII